MILIKIILHAKTMPSAHYIGYVKYDVILVTVSV